MNYEFERAMQQWRSDVDAEATRLIGLGFSPWEAIQKAGEEVLRRKREESIRTALWS